MSEPQPLDLGLLFVGDYLSFDNNPTPNPTTMQSFISDNYSKFLEYIISITQKYKCLSIHEGDNTRNKYVLRNEVDTTNNTLTIKYNASSLNHVDDLRFLHFLIANQKKEVDNVLSIEAEGKTDDLVQQITERISHVIGDVKQKIAGYRNTHCKKHKEDSSSGGGIYEHDKIVFEKTKQRLENAGLVLEAGCENMKGYQFLTTVSKLVKDKCYKNGREYYTVKEKAKPEAGAEAEAEAEAKAEEIAEAARQAEEEQAEAARQAEEEQAEAARQAEEEAKAEEIAEAARRAEAEAEAEAEEEAKTLNELFLKQYGFEVDIDNFCEVIGDIESNAETFLGYRQNTTLEGGEKGYAELSWLSIAAGLAVCFASSVAGSTL